MPAAGLIESFLNGRCALPISVSDEATWHRTWSGQGLDKLSPVFMALQGGFYADRLPWVFIAGYQAAIRYVFPSVPPRGWAAYAATEDKSDPDSHPPVMLSAEGRLNGYKTWIAQSRHVDHLLVTVNDGAHCVLISSDAPGVELSHRDAPGFLSAMSQGFARFDDVAVDVERSFDNEQMREFGRREPRYVMLAGIGFLLGQLKDADQSLQQDLISLALAAAAVCESQDIVHKTMAALDRGLQDAIARFADVVDVSAIPNWHPDRRLLSMYSERLQKRAAR